MNAHTDANKKAKREPAADRDRNLGMALEIYERMLALLPLTMRYQVAKPPKDPAPLRKAGFDSIKLRVLPLPGERRPACFWSSTWCFYELKIGAGAASAGGPVDGLTLGGIAFVQFPTHPACGAGRYLNRVTTILEPLAFERRDFRLKWPGEGAERSLAFGCAYSAETHPAFPVEAAARDLAWLINSTLPRFQRIPTAGYTWPCYCAGWSLRRRSTMS